MFRKALLALLVLGCSTAPDAPELVVQLRGTEFRGDSLGNLILLAELVNVGTATAHTSYCAGQPAGAAVNWSVERWSAETWVGRESPFFACAPPTFGSLELAPRARFVDTLYRRLEPGIYRLRVFYRAADSPDVLESYRSSASPQFTIQP